MILYHHLHDIRESSRPLDLVTWVHRSPASRGCDTRGVEQVGRHYEGAVALCHLVLIAVFYYLGDELQDALETSAVGEGQS